ncbi:MAG: OmpA family protein, partial [Pseudolabrys sp.]
YRLSIVGHTASSKVPPKPGYGPWELSADRANAVRQILDAEGVRSGNIYMVAGKADTDPLFPDDPYMSPNRRVTITLMRARFWMRRVCRQGTSIWWPARSHTASSKVPPKPGYGPWELSADRANAVPWP